MSVFSTPNACIHSGMSPNSNSVEATQNSARLSLTACSAESMTTVNNSGTCQRKPPSSGRSSGTMNAASREMNRNPKWPT